MNRLSPLNPELAELLEALCCGELSPADAERLEALVQNDKACLDQYILFLHIHALAERFQGSATCDEAKLLGKLVPAAELTSSTEASPSAKLNGFALPPQTSGLLPDYDLPWEKPRPKVVIETSPPRPIPWYSVNSPIGLPLIAYSLGAIIMLIAIGIGALVHVNHSSEIVTSQAASNEKESGGNGELSSALATAEKATPKKEEPPVVGHISGMADCRWADPSFKPIARRIRQGAKFALVSGLMEITYTTGAKVILQGPCTYEVESPSGGYLALGKLTAKVGSGQQPVASAQSHSANHKSAISNHKSFSSLTPSHSPLFTVRTPTALITDLGTEFGVEVDRSGATRSYVFQGSVKLCCITNGRLSTSAVRLGLGEFVSIDARGAVTKIPGKGEFFVRDLRPALAAAVRRQREAQIERYRNDPALVAYYPFDNELEAPGRLLNRAAATAGRLDGVLGEPGKPETRPNWADGRVPGKRALRFEAEKEQVVVVPHEDLLNSDKGLTVTAWVKPHLPLPPHSRVILSYRDREAEGFQLSIVGPAKENPYSIQMYTGVRGSDYSGPVLPEREEWWHVAATLGRGFKQFYLNGRLVDQVGNTSTNAEPKSNLWIGAAPPWLGRGRCWFDGLIGEIWIFRRVLAPAEIRNLYDLESFREFTESTARAADGEQSLDSPAGATQSSSEE